MPIYNALKEDFLGGLVFERVGGRSDFGRHGYPHPPLSRDDISTLRISKTIRP